jgi:hypothetical protein
MVWKSSTPLMPSWHTVSNLACFTFHTKKNLAFHLQILGEVIRKDDTSHGDYYTHK